MPYMEFWGRSGPSGVQDSGEPGGHEPGVSV